MRHRLLIGAALALAAARLDAAAVVGYTKVQDRYLLNCYAATTGDRPSSPAEGTTCFVDADNTTYVWSDGAWTALAGGGGVTDHGALTGLGDDDHTQYGLLAGRSGGQTLYGGTAGTDDLFFYANTTSGAPVVALYNAGGNNAVEVCASSGASAPGNGCSIWDSVGLHISFGAADYLTVEDDALGRVARVSGGGQASFEGIFGLGSDSEDLATQTCMDLDSDRFYGDKDCDSVKDAGEEYLDQASGGSITLDLGDDGGNDSVALAEITSVGDDHGAMKEISADKLQIDIARIGNFGDYHPDRKPTSGLDANGSDEFTNTINTGIQTLGNWGTATATAELDALRFHTAASASRDRKVIWYALPASGDWMFSTSYSAAAFDFAPAFVAHGISALVTGTTGTPTLMEMCLVYRGNSSSTTVVMYNTTSYTATYNNALGTGSINDQFIGAGPRVYVRARFTDSSNDFTCDWSSDGWAWDNIGTRTSLSANPTSIGIFMDQNTANVATDSYFHFVRLCTSGACLSSPWPIGEP